MQVSVKPSIADWYNVLHTEDWQHEPLKAGEEYYLVEPTGEEYYSVDPIKRYVDVISADEIRIYLDLDREASDNWVAYVLDEKYPGWSIEIASEEKNK